MNALQQFLQAASNEAAGAVSGPVDLIGMGLRKLGVPVPKNALMSSEWMKQNGLMQDVPQSGASLAGQTFGLLSPVVAAAKAPQIARGLLTMGENAAAQVARPKMGQMGAINADALKAAFPELDISLRQRGDIAYLDKVAVPEGSRNSGRGSEFMEALTKAADADGARLGLSPSDAFGGSKGRLEEFYKRFGFEFNKGRARDLELMASMVRQPRQ